MIINDIIRIKTQCDMLWVTNLKNLLKTCMRHLCSDTFQKKFVNDSQKFSYQLIFITTYTYTQYYIARLKLLISVCVYMR